MRQIKILKQNRPTAKDNKLSQLQADNKKMGNIHIFR
jgi:hypothetical protein